MKQPEYLTTAAVAAEFFVTRRAVLKWIAADKIKATKFGEGRTSAYLIPASEVARLKRAQGKDAA